VGYERFAAAMQAARRKAPADPASQMRAASDGYLAFAVTNPALFRLMFSADLLDWTDNELLRVARLSRAELAEICAPAADMFGLHGTDHRAALERLVWAASHGRAHLTIDGQMPVVDPSPAAQAAQLDIADLIFRTVRSRPTAS
jgi:hypothetical protein